MLKTTSQSVLSRAFNSDLCEYLACGWLEKLKEPTTGGSETGGGCRVDLTRSPRAAEAARLPGAVCALVGELPQLGGWDPKKAWKFKQKKIEEGAILWEGSFTEAKVPVGQQFKYCILHEASNTYVWEEAGPMHSWPLFDEIQDFEAGAPPPSAHGGHGGHLHWPPATAKPKLPEGAGDRARVLGAGTEQRIPWQTGAPCAPRVKAPRSIFHAFHWPFGLVLERLQDIADLGFDAVQISPAQKSKHGHEWWARYQPQDYGKIEGLGSWEELKQLCTKARELKLRVIGDVVFNHMLVVGSCHEWRHAQKDPGKLKELQQRLVQQTPMKLEDFQWPWLEMSGDNWDNENRYEGWGSGEWSELRYCPRVVQMQQQHLQLLLDAGVTGIRFDAVKHLRPAHLEEHLRHLRKDDEGLFAYGEVLDETMHKEYMALECPSSDFPLTVFMTRALSEGMKAVDEGVTGACARAAKTSGLKGAVQFPSSALSCDSVRFARNHDTVMNPNLYYGLGGGCDSATLQWAWLLSLHDGSVLVFPEDLQQQVSSSLICRALRFRQRMELATATEVVLRYEKTTAPPVLLLLALKDAGDKLLGMAMLNLCRETVKVSTGLPLPSLTRLVPLDGTEEVEVQPDGRFMQPLLLAAQDAEFLVRT
eukprot:s201_g21.t1